MRAEPHVPQHGEMRSICVRRPTVRHVPCTAKSTTACRCGGERPKRASRQARGDSPVSSSRAHGGLGLGTWPVPGCATDNPVALPPNERAAVAVRARLPRRPALGSRGVPPTGQAAAAAQWDGCDMPLAAHRIDCHETLRDPSLYAFTACGTAHIHRPSTPQPVAAFNWYC